LISLLSSFSSEMCHPFVSYRCSGWL